MRLTEHSTAAEPCRAEINRRNAQHSTGPRTAAGKTRSSQNAFKHGLHSKKFIFPDECAAEFDELRATVRREHQPANTTEEILVDELAQNFWRMRRFRELEASAWQPDSKLFTTGILSLLARSLASAERGFHRSLTALTKLQKARGFVPQKQEPAPAIDPETAEEYDGSPSHPPCDDDIHDETHLLRPPDSPQSGSPQRIQRTPVTGLAQ